MGDPTDVKTAQRLYPFITPRQAKTEGQIMGLAYRLGPLWPLSLTSEFSYVPCLMC